MPQLTARDVDRAKPGPRRRLIGDGGGLFLAVQPSGAKSWVLRTRVDARRSRSEPNGGAKIEMGLGSTSWMSLAEAREEARKWRAVARRGEDPIVVRRAEKEERKRSDWSSMTFAEAARATWSEQIEPAGGNAKHVKQWLSSLETYAFPTIGSRPVGEIEPAEVTATLSPIWLEKPETARRVRQRIRTVMDWAIIQGRRSAANPVVGIGAGKGLPKQSDRARHHAAMDWRDLPDFWARLSGAKGAGAEALRFLILCAARSGEVRGATWEEIDLERALWTVPAERMKARREHRVPLSPSALAALTRDRESAEMRTGLLFPSSRPGKPISDMTISAVLKRMKADATPHGFRSSFRTWAEEATSYPHEAKESALAHVVGDKVEAAYRRTDLLEMRRRMMDEWAGFVTGEAEPG